MKLGLHGKSPKTVNNVLSVLSMLLKQAVEWGVLQKMPCSIRLMRVTRTDAAFHDFEAYERLLEAAEAIDPRSYLIALLGGEAGLRAGEIVAREWADIDLDRRQIIVRHSDWNGELTPSHVLLAPGDAGRADARGAGAGRTPEPGDDAAITRT